MKVVFDTNIFISAFVFQGGQAEKALLRLIEGENQLIISKPIIDEFLGVLARKFSRDSEELARLAIFLTEIGQIVYPKRKINVLNDDPDNRILECAIEGRADIIVTGDQAMLKLGKYRGLRIITLRDYFEEAQLTNI